MVEAVREVREDRREPVHREQPGALRPLGEGMHMAVEFVEQAEILGAFREGLEALAHRADRAAGLAFVEGIVRFVGQARWENLDLRLGRRFAQGMDDLLHLRAAGIRGHARGVRKFHLEPRLREARAEFANLALRGLPLRGDVDRFDALRLQPSGEFLRLGATLAGFLLDGFERDRPRAEQHEFFLGPLRLARGLRERRIALGDERLELRLRRIQRSERDIPLVPERGGVLLGSNVRGLVLQRGDALARGLELLAQARGLGAEISRLAFEFGKFFTSTRDFAFAQLPLFIAECFGFFAHPVEFGHLILGASPRGVAFAREAGDLRERFGQRGGVLRAGVRIRGAFEQPLAHRIEFAHQFLHLRRVGAAFRGHGLELLAVVRRRRRVLLRRLLRGLAVVFEFGDLVGGAREFVAEFQILRMRRVPRLAHGQRLLLRLRGQRAAFVGGTLQGLEPARAVIALALEFMAMLRKSLGLLDGLARRLPSAPGLGQRLVALLDERGHFHKFRSQLALALPQRLRLRQRLAQPHREPVPLDFHLPQFTAHLARGLLQVVDHLANLFGRVASREGRARRRIARHARRRRPRVGMAWEAVVEVGCWVQLGHGAVSTRSSSYSARPASVWPLRRARQRWHRPCLAQPVPNQSRETTIETALLLQKAGRLEEAARDYRQILTADPRQPDALHLLGVIAHDVGKLDEAVELIAESLRVNPNNPSAINNLAGVLKDQERYDEALEFYDAALAASPEQAHIHSNRGNVLKEQGRLEEAIGAYGQALALNPSSYAAHCNLGTVFKEQGRNTEAIECFQRALALNPHSHECQSNLGVALLALSRHEEAESAFRAALKMNPKSPAAHTNLGSALKEQGRPLEAMICHLQALELNPKSHYAYNNLGMALKELGRFAEAAGCFEKALAIKPDSHLAHNNLGSALCELGRAGDALDCFRRALEIKPSYHQAFSNLLFTQNYLVGVDRAAFFAEHRRFDAQFCEPLRQVHVPHTNDPDPARRLRIGFVSGDLREHPVAYLIEPVFAQRSRDAFEVFCYSNQTMNDAMTERLRSLVDHWRPVTSLDDDALAAAIRHDGIDILVDLSGHTARHRLFAFARKPAPIQVSMIGYMQTTGLSTMDYRITDETLDPINVSDPYNSEKLIRLPSGAAPFRPPADCPTVNELPALKTGYVTFGAFNNMAKITPEAIEAWAAILKSLPTSRLIVVGRIGNPVQATIETHGVSPDRVEMLDRLPLKEYVALHHRVDFLLDTFPYNGGTTNLIAAWMGVPFVTLAGASSTSRAGAGVLKAIGLSELVADNSENYVERAIAAVRDLPRLAGWRAALRPRLVPLLGDGKAYTSELENAFREIWRQWCATKS